MKTLDRQQVTVCGGTDIVYSVTVLNATLIRLAKAPDGQVGSVDLAAVGSRESVVTGE